jgi:methyltransferase, FkbM family
MSNSPTRLDEVALRVAKSDPYGAWAPSFFQRVLLVLSHNTILGRGRGRRLGARLLQAFRAGPIDYVLGNVPFRFDIRNNSTDRQSLLRPKYNQEEYEFLAEKLGANAVFVDIGANTGFFSVKIAAQCGRQCQVVAIEPNPAVLDRLYFNCQTMLDRIKIVNVAAGRTPGVARFHSNSRNLGESRLGLDGEIEIEVKPLHDILQSLGVTHIDALKIDVEGFEDDVIVPFFSSAPQSLWPRRIVLEYTSRSDWKEDCLDLLFRKGYRQFSKTRGNVLLELGEGV